MAGDIPADERVRIEPAGTDGDAANRTLRPEGAPVDATPPGGGPVDRVVHRYGRVQILSRPQTPGGPARPRSGALASGEPEAGDAEPADAEPEGLDLGPDDTGDLDTGDLDLGETLGLAAFRLRESPDYLAVKAYRPRAGEVWDMDGACTDVAPPRGRDTGAESADVETGRVAEAATTRAPTSAFMEGSVAVGLVLVEGPTPALRFSPAERTKIVAEVQNGLSWHVSQNPAADIVFDYDIQIVRLQIPANPGAADLEAHWRNPAMAELGFQPSFDGVYDYVDLLRARLATRWSYCAFFTRYPLRHFAYAAIGGPRLVMSYDNDGWGPDNIDRVFAHETSHIFGAVDEYASSGCDCGGAWGRFSVRNGNCDACAPTPVTCLMLANAFQFCDYTPAHVGWGRGVAGNPAMVQSTFGRRGNFDLVVPSAFAGITHVWRDNDAFGFPWRDPFQTAHSLGHVDAVSMVQSTLADPGPLEAVARAGTELVFLWRDGVGFTWRNPVRIAQGVVGTPCLIQSRLGARGNFELLAPAAGVGILHMWRNHDVQGFPWSTPRLFAANLGHVDAVSLVHGSRGGGGGVLEAVALVGGRLVHLWRDTEGVWRTTVAFADGIRGNPVLLESRFGPARNFEVVAPALGGGLVHHWRNNSAPGTPWSAPRRFAAELGPVDAVGMIQSNFDGNLEVIARAGDRLFQIWRSSDGVWSRPSRFF
jgi:hypothetical protein